MIDRKIWADALARARKRTGFTQEDVALLLGQPRPVVANWESGVRQPASHHLQKLATIYRVELAELLGGAARLSPDFESLFFRDAGDRIDHQGKYEIQRFLSFLDAYGDFLESMGEPPGMAQSPFSVSRAFTSKEDVRRRAGDARRYFGLDSGPVGDIVGLADLHGITVYQTPLGTDLRRSVSGAFLPHDRVGFSILVNTHVTPARKLFALAHELAHALFHGDRAYVDYPGRREAAERFAHAFAAEFLIPIKSLRAVCESLSVSRVTDPEIVVHIQRLFGVSYGMMLARLQTAGLMTGEDLDHLRNVRPVHLAAMLGRRVSSDEWEQDPDGWELSRLPRRFRRLLRRAFREERITLGGAAAMTGLAHDEIEKLVADRPADDEEDLDFEYLRSSA